MSVQLPWEQGIMAQIIGDDDDLPTVPVLCIAPVELKDTQISGPHKDQPTDSSQKLVAGETTSESSTLNAP